MLSLSNECFPKFYEAGEVIGSIKREIANELGFNTVVKSVYSHDTAAACYGANVKEGELFLSSGTWSLIGAVNDKMVVSEKILNLGFTNELNNEHYVRFLKNIIGMFIITKIESEQSERINIEAIVKMAQKGENYTNTFDPTDSRFLAPVSMVDEIKNYFVEKNLIPPKDLQELFYCVYHSLAICYSNSIKEIETLLNNKYTILNVFGGGSKNMLLNDLTEKIAHIKIAKGPSEATAIGNIRCQIK